MSRYNENNATDMPAETRSLVETLAVAEKRLEWALESLEDLDIGVAGGSPANGAKSTGMDPKMPTLMSRAEHVAALAGRLADRIATLRSIVLGPEVAQNNARA